MRIRRFFRRSQWDEERRRELEAYLAQETDDNLARGMTPERAPARPPIGSLAMPPASARRSTP
jgi:hypothetical protein